jgi:hypothetical protein
MRVSETPSARLGLVRCCRAWSEELSVKRAREGRIRWLRVWKASVVRG